ncbi:MAG: sigma factor [Planctomycetota bacterium]
MSDHHTLAVQQLFVKHQQLLRAFVAALAPDFPTADDVMQETFLEVTLKASEFQLDSNFPAWARSIAKFKVLSHARDRQRNSARLADDVIETRFVSGDEFCINFSKHRVDLVLRWARSFLRRHVAAYDPVMDMDPRLKIRTVVQIEREPAQVKPALLRVGAAASFRH